MSEWALSFFWSSGFLFYQEVPDDYGIQQDLSSDTFSPYYLSLPANIM